MLEVSTVSAVKRIDYKYSLKSLKFKQSNKDIENLFRNLKIWLQNE